MLIQKFYETYLLEEDKENVTKEILLDFLSHKKLSEEEMLEAESYISELQNSEAERAFVAGFKKAFELLVEVMA